MIGMISLTTGYLKNTVRSASLSYEIIYWKVRGVKMRRRGRKHVTYTGNTINIHKFWLNLKIRQLGRTRHR
jgi:hypothetical protein